MLINTVDQQAIRLWHKGLQRGKYIHPAQRSACSELSFDDSQRWNYDCSIRASDDFR